MKQRGPRFLVLFVILASALGGCAATEPYIYKAEEFNRDAPTFRKEPLDLTRVRICFSGLNQSAAQLDAMAEAACAHYGKMARNRRDRIGVCPLLTPWEARYDCVAR